MTRLQLVICAQTDCRWLYIKIKKKHEWRKYWCQAPIGGKKDYSINTLKNGNNLKPYFLGCNKAELCFVTWATLGSWPPLVLGICGDGHAWLFYRVSDCFQDYQFAEHPISLSLRRHLTVFTKSGDKCLITGKIKKERERESTRKKKKKKHSSQTSIWHHTKVEVSHKQQKEKRFLQLNWVIEIKISVWTTELV